MKKEFKKTDVNGDKKVSRKEVTAFITKEMAD